MSNVILVNEQDEAIGIMDKMEVHRKGMLHRAFSIFIFNSKGEMLLQQRASDKYHSGDLWTNACCSHPRPGEIESEAANRRLFEEMGFITPLQKSFSFTYQTVFDNGLIEHEFDHVFTGIFEGEIRPDNNEVKDFCYMDIHSIRNDIRANPENYTAWFKIAFPKVERYLANSPG